MTGNEIISYQFAERVKSALIIGSKMLIVLETLGSQELEGAKKMINAFFDALSAETALAINATEMHEFELVEEKIERIMRRIEEGNFDEAQITLGTAVTHATTACASTMSALTEKGLM